MFTWEEIGWVGILLVLNYSSGNFPGENCLGGNLPRGKYPNGNYPGFSFPGGNYVRGNFSSILTYGRFLPNTTNTV